MSPIFQSCAGEILDDWRKKTKGGSSVVDVYHYLEEYTGASVAKMLFSHEYDADMQTCFNLLRDLALMSDIGVKTFDLPGIRRV